MIFHYAGKYNGNEDNLPKREHPINAKPFKEIDDIKKISLIATAGGLLTTAILAVPYYIFGLKYIFAYMLQLSVASICAVFSMVTHELLHAICFKKDVYMYQDLAHGVLFVVGTEDMSKKHFIFMCLLPNVVLGVIPYIIFLIFPNLAGLGFFGIICIATGFGDYINVYNAIKQMPKNAKTYLSGIHSFWYLP